ncbi:MAG: GAF domain-containing protein [Anaerolineales bacterium]|nr:GAF domain-containing protein [Anaerolineales bacterium]MCB9146891.1 GAF domain-containing protein [Anaerolineales bacterium]
MNKWFLKIFNNLDEVSQTGLSVNTILLMSVFLTLPPSIYLAVQSNTWQINLVVAGILFLLVVALLGIFLSIRNRGRPAMGITLIVMALIAPFLTSMVSGVGWAVALTVAVIYIAISVQTSMRERTIRALVLGGISVIATFAVDFYTPWERLSSPLLQTVVPLATLALIFAFGWFSLQLFRNFSLRIKMIVGFLVIGLITTSAIGIVTNLIATAQLSSVLETNLSGVATRMARQAGDTLSVSQIALESLSLNKFVQDSVEQANLEGTPDLARLNSLDNQWKNASDQSLLIQNVLNNELAGELLELQERLPQYAELFVTDQYGAVIASTGRTSDYYQADEEWWQGAWNNGDGDLYISQPVYDESAGIYAIEIALPIPAHNRPELVGVLRATVSINEVTNILTVSELGETGNAYLLLPSNEILTSELESIETLNEKTLTEIKSFQNNFGEITVGETKNIASSAVVNTNASNSEVIKNLNWTIIVYKDLNDAYKPVSATTNSIFLLAVALLILTFFVAQYLGGQLIHPIEILSSAAIDIGKGNLSTRADVDSKDEVGTLARAFNTMAEQLGSLLGELEERVAARTKDLATVAEVGTVTSTILESNRLLQEVVNLTKERFNLYHSHIYLLDEEGKNLVLTAGAGEPGRIMAAERRSIPINREQSLVARAARERKGIIVNDVTEAPDFLPNPLLPDTRAELAVPMIVSNTLIGVFDIQSDQAGRFTTSDIDIQTTLAAQLATSIQNVRSFEQSKKQADFEARVNLIGQKIQQATSIEETLQTAVRELGTAIGAPRVKVDISSSNDGMTNNKN